MGGRYIGDLMREWGTGKRLFWTLHLSGWAAFGVGMALSRLGRYPIDYMVATKLVLAVTGTVFALALRALYRRVLPDDASISRTVLVTSAASFIVSLVWTAVYNLSDAPIATAMLGQPMRIENVSQLFAASYYHTFAMLAWSVFYVGLKRQRAMQVARERALRAEALAHQARLQALRFQIQPHFLFNTLNALSTLIVEQRSQEASQMLSRLSDFLRHTLTGPATEEVALRDELEFARRYLDIEHVRFGDRLRVEVDVAPDAQEARVPTMLLQPLLENAVRHGIAPSVQGGTVQVSARRDGEMLRLSIVNDFTPSARASTFASLSAGSADSNGVGLANTRARLQQLYGDHHRLDALGTHQGFRVDITLPFRERDA
jgi:two-component system LytT family sensor kinase